MLTTTHFIVVVLAAMFLRLDKNEWFIALMFGVVIDFDHVFGLPRYVSDNGWGALLRQSWDDGSGLPWKSWFHYPMAAMIVGYLSPGWRYLLPLSFWALHVGMDGLQLMLGDMNTVFETGLMFGSLAGIFYIAYSDWALLSGRSGLREYAGFLASSSRAKLSGLRGTL